MLSISNQIKFDCDSIFFEKIADAVLGKKYDLSLVFVGNKLARELNKKHKNKDTPTNVLSFPLGKNEGEIILNPSRAKRDAKSFLHSTNEHIVFLFIHGCLHLKGHTHGHKMESLEKKFFGRFAKK